jgi:hypothetical protein
MSGHQLINLEKYFYDMVTVLSRKNILGSMKKIYIKNKQQGVRINWFKSNEYFSSCQMVGSA